MVILLCLSGDRAVFVESGNVDANTVVAYRRHSDGTLTRSGVYRTGGKGGVLTGSVVDHTASQGSLVLSGGHLYAVIPGSNTVTVFSGDFPVSMTVHGNLVYTLNARRGGAIQGYAWIGHHLVRVLTWRRALDLDTTQTSEFTHTPGQVAFTPDGRHLVVATKAASSSIDVFNLHSLAGPAQCRSRSPSTRAATSSWPRSPPAPSPPSPSTGAAL